MKAAGTEQVLAPRIGVLSATDAPAAAPTSSTAKDERHHAANVPKSSMAAAILAYVAVSSSGPLREESSSAGTIHGGATLAGEHEQRSESSSCETLPPSPRAVVGSQDLEEAEQQQRRYKNRVFRLGRAGWSFLKLTIIVGLIVGLFLFWDWFQNRVLEFRSGVADVSLWLMLPSWAFLNIFRKLLPPLYPLIMCDFVIQIFLVEKYGARVGAGVFQLLALSDIITFIILRLVYKKFTPCVDSFFDAKQPTKWWQSDEVRSTLLWLDTLWWNRMERYSWLMRCIFVVGFGTTYWSYPYAALLWLAMRSQIHVVAYAIGLVLALCADYFRMVCRLHLFDMFGKVSLESSILFPVILYKKEPLFVLGVTIMTSSVAFLWVHGFTGVACLVRIARWCQPRCSKVMGSEACCCLTVVKEAFPSIWGSRLQRRGEGRWGFGLPDHPLGVLDGGNVDDEEMMVERRFTVPRLVVEEDVDHDVAVAASDEEDLRSITVMSGSSAAGGAARAEAAKAEVVGNEQGHSRMNSFSTDEMSSNENEGGGMPRSSSRSSLLLNSSPLYREDESPRGTGRKKRGNAKGRFPSTNGWCSPGLTGSTATLAPPLPPPSSPRDAADAAAVDASASVKATGKGGGGESSTAAVGGEEKSEIDVLKAHGLFMSF